MKRKIKFIIFILFHLFLLSPAMGVIKNGPKIKVPEEAPDSIFQMPLSERDHKSGLKILNLYRAAKNVISPDKLQEIESFNFKVGPFGPFENWARFLKKISQIKNLEQYFQTCPDILNSPTNLFYDIKLFHQLERQCYVFFLNLAKAQLGEGKHLDQKSLEYFEKNMEHFLKDINIAYLKNLLMKIPANSEAHLKTSQVIAKIYTPLSKGFDFSLFKWIYSAKELKNLELLRNNQKYYENELKQLSRSIKRDLQRREKAKNEVIKKTLEFINFYQINQDRLISQDALLVTLSLGKHLLMNHYHNLSGRVLGLVLERTQKGPLYHETLFQILWAVIIQGDYKKSAGLMGEYRLHDEFENLPSNFQFWMAYVMEKIGQIQLAINYFQKTIDRNPLSFYSIMASKKLANLMDPKNPSGKKDILLDKIFNETSPLIINKKSFTQGFLNSVIRFNIWSKLNDQNFLGMESNYLLNLPKEQVFVDPLTLKDLDPTQFSGQMTLLAAKLLSSSTNYLRSFTIIQKQLENNQIIFSKDFLNTLFPKPFQGEIESMAQELDPIIILALIRQESAFNPSAKSRAGAIGLMQLMPSTAKLIKRNISHSQLRNPQINLKIGIQYLKKLLKKYNGNLVYTFAAYNAGEKNLEKWVREFFTTDSLLHTIESIPFNETKVYVKLIFRNIFFYKALGDNLKDGNQINKLFDIHLVQNQEI